jgi:hypothetical protein
MQDESPLAVVAAWQEAVNRQDVEGLLELSDPNVEIVGPRGSVYGHEMLREWMGRAGLNLEPLRTFARGDVVVVEQRGVWRSIETREVMGEQVIASRFHVEGQRVTRYARYDSLEEALDEAGLDEGDEV